MTALPPDIPPEPTRADELLAAGGRIVFPVIWFAVALAIAFGGAGVVAALDHQPGTPARAELTWAGDSAVAPTLDSATADLENIARLVDELGLQGRGALAALAARDFEVLDGAVADGTLLVERIRSESTLLARKVNRLEGFGGPNADLRLSRSVRDRHATLVEAAEATTGLTANWARLTSGGLAAGRLAGLLTRHDERITAAIDVGRQGEFETALARIDEATAALDEADALRDRLAPTTDTTTLDEWLRRNRRYDEALRNLYVVSAETTDRVTPELRAALRAEQAARAQLPRTTNGLTIVMADIAQGGLNQAVIEIEQARGEIAAALAALSGEAAPAS
jgi:hypothetical protein